MHKKQKVLMADVKAAIELQEKQVLVLKILSTFLGMIFSHFVKLDAHLAPDYPEVTYLIISLGNNHHGKT